MIRHALRNLELAAVAQVLSNAGGAKRVIAVSDQATAFWRSMVRGVADGNAVLAFHGSIAS